MKKIFTLAAAVFALALTGCDDVQVSAGAGWGVDRISYGPYYGRGWDYRDHMHRRQRNWRDYNDRNWGGRPGWGGHHGGRGGRGGHHGGTIGGGRGGHHGGNHGGGRGGNHGGGIGGGHRFVTDSIMPVMAVSAPALTKQDVAVYASIGRVYGIGPKTSTRVLEAVNRAAVGDFGGLADLGLNKSKLTAAKRNDGRLATADLDRLSRKLGVNQQKLDSMIQDVLRKR